MRNVVVQWARLGDLLQTRILLRKIAESSPGGEVILCGDVCYREIACAFPELTEYWPIELSRLSALARHTESQAEFLAMFSGIANELRAKPIDNVYVITRSLAAITFAEMLNPARLIGYSRKGYEIRVPAELAALEQTQNENFPNPLHLADLWGGFAPGSRAANWLPPLAWPGTNGDAIRSTIGIFCEAGEAHRTIPVEWLEYLVQRWSGIETNDIRLFGKVAVEDGLGRIAASSNGRVVDYRGQTPLPTLCDRLAECKLVVGPDTGGLHLAAALHIPVIGFYFGGARPELTGPYAEYAQVICEPSWTPETAEQVIAMGQQGNPEGSGFRHEAVSDRIMRPVLADHGLTYHSVIPSEHMDASVSLSIIIPECGAVHYTDQLLADLSTQEDIDRCEIILVTSGESSRRLLPSLYPARINVMRTEKMLSFAQACNQGAESAVGDYLLFLNNDTRLTSGLLQRLLCAANSEEILSPTILYPDGLIQNAGVTIRDHEIREIGHGEMKLSEVSEQPDAVSAIALLLSRKAFMQLAGFDDGYINGYEDLDLSLRAAQTGLRFRVDPTARLVHFRSSTHGRFDHEDANKARFVSKWASVLERPFQVNTARKSLQRAPLLLVSHEFAAAAGSCLRWMWPLQDLGLVPDRDFVWINESDALTDLNAFRQSVESAQGIVVFRPLLHAAVQAVLLHQVDRTGTPLCVDSDDLVIGRFQSGSKRGQARSDYEARFISLLQRASLVTASTPALVESLQHFGVETMLLSTRPNLRQRKNGELRSDRQAVHMGFFGTPAHLVDLGNILPAIECALDANPNLSFYWWGCRPGNLVGHPQVRQGGPLVADYGRHLHRLHNFPLDFAIVPLLDAPASHVRSAIKYFEYALAGLPVVYSAVKPYTEFVTDQHNGLLVENSTPAWFDAMNIMANQPEIRTCLARNAEYDMTNRLSRSISRQSLRRLVSDLLRGPQTVCAAIPFEEQIPCTF